MEKTVCTSCQKVKASLQCISCQEAVCKTCAKFVDEHTFLFLPALPGALEAGTYCEQCYQAKVQPEVEIYEAKVAQARDISIFMKDQGKEVRSYKRAQFPVKIENCEDRNEALIRLAFLAVGEGYDTLINVDLSSKKVRNGSYQKAMWNATGTPAENRRKKPVQDNNSDE